MVISGVKKQTSDIAKRAARQILQEPSEILRGLPEQITGAPGAPVQPIRTQESLKISPQDEAKMKAQGQRQIQALEAELKAIGEQQVATEQQKNAQKPQIPEKTLTEPVAKRSRRLFSFGKKTQAERQKTRVERPLTPSG